MESGLLDFNDLMDTGDDYPGFSIAKFTPANGNGNDEDGVLRTPEHEQTDDFELTPSHKSIGDEDNSSAVSEKSKLVNGGENQTKTESHTTYPDERLNEADKKSMGENFEDSNSRVDDFDRTDSKIESGYDHCNSKTGQSEDDSYSKTGDDEGNNSEAEYTVTEDVKAVELKMECADDAVESSADAAGEESSEMAMTEKTGPPKSSETKNKYKSLPRPKMRMWSGKSNSNEDSKDSPTQGDEDNSPMLENGEDCSEGDGHSRSSMKGSEERGPQEEEEEDPHQQSFLSFLNLKPGMSKPLESTEKVVEAKLEEEFYSRKRLRTRKKVSYVEEVEDTEDEDYDAENSSEEAEDHMIDLDSPKRKRSRTNSRSPGQAGGVTPAQMPLTYAMALQKLLPGMNLQYLNNKPIAQAQPKQGLKQVSPVAPRLPSPARGSVYQAIKGLFECGVCGLFFSTATQFLQHQESKHSADRKTGLSPMETFRCEICGFVLTNRFAYLEHKKMKHNKGVLFNCNTCKSSFQTQAEFQVHQLTCVFTCKTCKSSFKSQAELKVHLLSCVFNCKTCRSSFQTEAELKVHLLSCTAPSCTLCGANFNSWVELGEHRIKVHNADQSATKQSANCVYKGCSFKAPTRQQLDVHVQSQHMNAELFACNVPKCSRVFSSRISLNQHKKEAHASEFIVQYQCVECKTCFSSKTLLAEHQYLHMMEKLRKCDLCSRSFSSFSDLRRHREVHIIKTSLKCQFCTRYVADPVELKSHICSTLLSKNTNLRMYFCDVCRRDFRSDEKMFLHRREHQNFYQCGVCFQDFSNETEYFKHRETHGNYTCMECCEEMDQESLNAHLKAHKYYVKLEDLICDGGTNERVMFLYPNLLSVAK
ncbi:PR domain zinc finger protein 5-like [Dreissena polymorpha]|uniref:C2H2-type domain-containing protein n=1 Tax=Dreissena polymorpha TaxID=45954 RepID=A0A9D4FXA1_DREPO|nr:PR domain zinc finger protein 5-like [Dreissena polymorpha]XP_052217406.1 PR domain zinc finger protein 5-like [Dreissena polymorpha]KAH3805274.1 hypothetical protein DPMN_133571 [Dreissena polymorpha]